MASLKELADKMTKQVLETLSEKNGDARSGPRRLSAWPGVERMMGAAFISRRPARLRFA